MINQTKHREWAVPAVGAAAVLSLGLIAAGCGGGGGGGGGGTTTTTSSTTISGNANQGPFQKGATAELRDLNGNTVVSGTVSDNYGAYSLTTTSTQILEVYAAGDFLDEYTGNIVPNGKISAVVDVANLTTGKSINPNVATEIAAQIVKKKGTNVTSADIQAAKTQVAQALGLSSTADIDTINPLDIYSGGADAAKVLTVSTTIGEALKTGAAADVATVMQKMADDLYSEGALIGTNSKAIGLDTYAQDVASAITDILQTVNSYSNATVSPYDAVQQDNTLLTTVTTAATSAVTEATTVKVVDVYGFTTVSDTAGTNTYTTFTVDQYGKATVASGGGTTPYNNVIVYLKAGAGQDYYVENYSGDVYSSLTLDIKDANGKRSINATLSDVVVTVSGTKITAVTVPANATLTVNSATDSAGNTVTVGTLTNVAADTVATVDTSGNVAVDVSQLLSIIQNKANNTSLNVLNTAGTFSFTITFNGINLGQNGTKFGSSITGSITTQ